LFWHPVCLSRELAKGQATPIRVLGEDYTLYRGEGGVPHVVDFRCPHRGLQLSVGSVKGDGIECRYHGWRFNELGHCVAQPGEAKPFCQKVSIGSYPAQEAMGLVLAYFGPLPAPPLPQWPEVEEASFTHRHRIDCNWFQSAENIVDGLHVHFAHRGSTSRKTVHHGLPKVSAEETPFGLSQRVTHVDSTKLNHWVMPNTCHIIGGFSAIGTRTLFWYVPIDDTSHHHFIVAKRPDDSWIRRLSLNARQVASSVLGRSKGTFGRANEIDEYFSRNARLVLSGERNLGAYGANLRLQDTVLAVGQGAIANRSVEHLGTSDVAVILLRKIWRRELRLLAEGKPITPVVRPEKFDTV
jgi:5,5'-dehydrodivanillate O-demethylase